MPDTNVQTALENLRKQVDEQRQQIDKLTKENKALRAQLGKGGGGVESGPSQAGAKAALLASLGKKKSGGDAGGVETGPSRGAAAAALLGALGKKKSGGDAGAADTGGADGNEAIFKKYEKMMKLGVSIHGALGRMVQNGENAEVIDAFKKKHAAKLGGDTGDEKHDLAELGLTAKRKIVFSSKNIKMKRLHWDPLNPTRVPNSIWEDLDETSVKYDAKKFELNFQVRERKQVVQESSKLTTLNSNEKRFFVPKKRAQQVMIGLRGLGLTNDQLRDVMHNMDEKVVTSEKLQQLMDIVPTEDEQSQAEKEVLAMKGNYKQFGESEQFFFKMCDFYHLHQRLRLWAFKMQFQELQSNLLDQFKQVQKTCEKVRNSKSLKQLLAIVLAFGNHMNAGTKKGEAFGFDLKILGQLQNIKTHDNSRSLLMYIYEICDQNYPKTLNILTELKPVLKISSSTETDTLNQLYDKIKENMKELKDIIESDDIEETYDMDDLFVKVMTKFYKKSQPNMKKFHMTVGNVLVSTKRLMKKFAFGSDENPEPVERLFGLLYQFLMDLENSKLKLIKLEKERAKKRKDRLKKKRKSDKARSAAKMGSVKTRKSQRGGGLAAPGGAGQGDDEDWSWDDYKGGTLKQALNKTLAFEESLQQSKSKLSGHLKNKASFVAHEGDLSKLSLDQRRSSTMRRVSSMYQADQEEVKKLHDARRKQRILGTHAALQTAKGISTPSTGNLAKFAGSIGNTPTAGDGNTPYTFGRTRAGGQTGDNFERERRGTPAVVSSPLPDDKVISAPRKFDRAPARNGPSEAKTVPTIATSVQAPHTIGTSPPTKQLPKGPKGPKDRKLPPNKQLPDFQSVPPPPTAPSPNTTSSSQTTATHARKKNHHTKGTNKHKGPSDAAVSKMPISKGGQQQFTAAQQQWMAQQQQQAQNFGSQPNLYSNPYQQQQQWTAEALYSYYYGQVAAQNWTPQQKQMWAQNQVQQYYASQGQQR